MKRKIVFFSLLVFCAGLSVYLYALKDVGLLHFLLIFTGVPFFFYLNFLEYQELKNDLFRRHLKEAEDAYQRKNPSNALKAFNKALKLRPKALEVYMGLAQCHRMLMQYDEALQNLARASEVEPTSFQPFFLSGMIHLQKNQPYDALVFFRKTEQANPKFVDAYFLMGQIQEKVGELREALRSYRCYVQHEGPFKGEIIGKIERIKERLGIIEEESFLCSPINCDEYADEAGMAPEEDVAGGETGSDAETPPLPHDDTDPAEDTREPS